MRDAVQQGTTPTAGRPGSVERSTVAIERNGPADLRGAARSTTALVLPPMTEEAVPGRWLVGKAVRLTLLMAVVAVVVAPLSASLLTVRSTARGTGTLEPLLVVPARVHEGGIVTEVLVRAGDSVAVGTPLLRLDPSPYRSENAELAAQGARLRQEGQRADALLPIAITERQAGVASANAAVLRANAYLRERMVEHGLGSDVQQLRGSYVHGKSIVVDRALADLLAAEADSASASAALLRVEEEWRQETARRRIERLALDARTTLLDDRARASTVGSPIDGVVLTEEPERLVGTMLIPGESALELAGQAGWRATVWLSDHAVKDVSAGQVTQVDVPALKGVDWSPLGGRVISVAREPGASSSAGPGGYRVLIQLDPAGIARVGAERLRRGYGVEARIVTSEGRALRVWLDRMLSR